MVNFFDRDNFSYIADKLFRVSNWLLSDKQESEDIVQDVFFKLTQINTSEIENIEAYAVRMARNLSLDKLKRKKFVDKNVVVEDLKIHQSSVEKNYVDKESINETQKALKTLPELYQSIIELRHIEGYTIKEISKILDIEPNYARVIMSRARKQLTTELKKIYPDEELY